MDKLHAAKILGINISTEKRSEILKKIIKSLKTSSQKFYIVTPNPEIMMYGLRDHEFQGVLNRAQVALPDGIGVLMASKIRGKGPISRITGVDFMEELVGQCAKEGLTTGFFGGGSGVAEKTAKCLHKSYPNLKVVFTGSEDKGLRSKDQRPIDVLFVALGFPKQEKWIAENLDKIPVKCAMGVGGAFDYLAGVVPRAPKLVRELGFEWLFRLIMQPWRIKRQIVLPQFIIRVILERFSAR